MNEVRFWDVVSLVNLPNGEVEGNTEAACGVLAKMSIEDIQCFEQILIEKLYALDTRAHASASLEEPNDFFSHDGFLYKRCFVVASGKEYFETVLQNPNKMPKDLAFELEELLYLPQNAYELKTGSKEFLPVTSKLSAETCSNSAGWAEGSEES